jgi:hypothetical protein
MTNKYDSYGFLNEENYDRRKDYPTTKKKIDTKKVIYIFLGSILGLFWLVSVIISGKYAWTEFPNDSTLIKLVRLWISVVFAPIYIFYIYIKTTVFKQQ